MNNNPCLDCGVDIYSCACKERCKVCQQWGHGDDCNHVISTPSTGFSTSPESWLKEKGLWKGKNDG